MANKINLLDFDDKVTNLSIPLDDAKVLRSTMSLKAFKEFVGSYIDFQLTGNEDTYQGKHKSLWNVMIDKKKKYFMKKHLKKTSVEVDNIVRTQAELLAKSKEKVEEQGILTGFTNLNEASSEQQKLFNNTLDDILSKK